MKRYPRYSVEDLKRTLKSVDAWWTVLVIDPVAIRLTLWTANRTKLHPNLFTLLSIILSLGSGYLFYTRLFLIGAFVYELSFLLDCVDGKLAILKGLNSDRGLWLDTISDKVRLLANTFGLACAGPQTWKFALVFLGLYLWDETENNLFASILEKRGENTVEGKETSKKSLMIKIRDSLQKRRLLGPFNLVEQDTFAFFIGPILRRPELGFGLAILLNIIGRAVSISHFWLWRYRGGDWIENRH